MGTVAPLKKTTIEIRGVPRKKALPLPDPTKYIVLPERAPVRVPQEVSV